MLFRKKIEATLHVEGIHCQNCAMKITNALKELKVKATVSLENKEVKIAYDDTKVTLEQIKNKINEIGFEVK